MTANSDEMNVAQLLVKCLEKEDVKYVFGIPGEEKIRLIDALNDSAKNEKKMKFL